MQITFLVFMESYAFYPTFASQSSLYLQLHDKKEEVKGLKMKEETQI